ncbi:hypothetical protein BN946_scf184940.g41 [Trametes cinnabarina]|uniref:Uncharacterized protein n=1 Tax=Pycnoporus cinnabarinus TaxID=5643 RepID=A0A060SI54_PYCCI|nr:hypothetical protein BN946_scf184940.g41 [Trametes cinnabarina]
MSESIRSKDSAVKGPEDLIPPRDRKGIRPVSPPLSNTPLHRFNYYIVIFAVMAMAFYAWRVLQWKSEVGGWWNLALGKRPPGAGAVVGSASASPTAAASGSSTGKHTIEDRINDLAAALGIPSKDLAVAIADAVREHVPPASLSSVAAHETGTLVQYLVDPNAAAQAEATGVMNGAGRGMGAVSSAIEAAVGLDEPPSEIGAV